jgi:hypothetical protein
MPVDKIYHPAALVSAAAYYVLGWLWYGVLFRNLWAGYSSDPVPFIIAAATAVVLAYVTTMMLHVIGDRSGWRGMQIGLLMGIGVVASTSLENSLFEGRSVTMWLIDAGYVVIGLAVIGAIVGGWKRSIVAQEDDDV